MDGDHLHGEGAAAERSPPGLADSFGSAAYGGAGWQPRVLSHAAELGSHWARAGIDSEWAPLETVLLSAPGPAMAAASADPNAAQLLAPVDLARARAEHAGLAAAYRDAGIAVLEVAPSQAHANQIFCADTFVMTPEGAILARPASAVRAGEEVAVAAALAGAHVPILATLTGTATFEGADLMWLDAQTAVIGRGLRTNEAAIGQIRRVLEQIGCDLIAVDMPWGVMHLMGMIRILDRDLAVAWPRRAPLAAVQAMEARGMRVAFPPRDLSEAAINTGLNVVTLGPRRIVMPAVAGDPDVMAMTRFYESLGVEVVAVGMAELRRAAGAAGCLTGIVARQRVG
ncbi:MAG: arginine deiminase family protein [Pseudomonadota bacterium]